MNNQKLLPKVLLGLEIHITVDSEKKIFNQENTYKENILPNSHVGPWELGYLGVLPTINSEVIYKGLKLATALGMKINKFINFDRKIYNYPDLSKGYQVTQQRFPFAEFGHLPLMKLNGIEKIPIKSLQLEEDTAKSIYSKEDIKLDFNRAGNPLIELVTEPVFSQIETVLIFIKQLRFLLRYLNISEAKMEAGQLRVDLNFSLKLGKLYSTPRYEIKNLNSLSNIKKSLKYEIDKHQSLFLRNQEPPVSQTLGFDENKQITNIHREKVNYFYLPEINIPPIKLRKTNINKIRRNLPVLPWKNWETMKENGVNNKNIDLIIKESFFLKLFIFLEKKQKLIDINEWIIFSLDYLNLYTGNKNFFLWFENRWKSYLKIFQIWKEKKITKEEISIIIDKLVNTKQKISNLLKKYHKKFHEIDNSLLLMELEKLWKAESLDKNFSSNPEKIRNYLLGKIKRLFPYSDIRKVNIIILKFTYKKNLK